MNKTPLFASIVALILPAVSAAETMNWRCAYTDSTYSAAFMKSVQNRTCPPSRCYYDISVDTGSNSARVNGTEGYSVSQQGGMLVLNRAATNTVMGGTDTAEFRIDTGNLSFEGRKTTTPSVTITTSGQCSAAM